ncbi:Wd repeat-containing protein 91-like protein [Thalictrum thalictroides]|uniref:Wd repeat-containing protein 91-like protein n=1 Tax=Thalictrum thalictroides TaxID=46969 RepID=A0A7J6VTI6_THATH|nr:Wd repeat-containing protein 91-like protein [Thalictrum thalictroides]
MVLVILIGGLIEFTNPMVVVFGEGLWRLGRAFIKELFADLVMLRRPPFDWERDQLTELQQKLQVIVLDDSIDSWGWKWNNNGAFTVKTMFGNHENSKNCRHEMTLDSTGRRLIVSSGSVRSPIYQVHGHVNGSRTFPHSAAITTVDWHPTLPIFLTGSADNSVRVTSIL